ncbi:MAG: branched-chain amino acid transaminase [Candidatus Micrarchaeota archaeon]|nr:branched-chain amino acid transaminase [Candidatus Micrarchaeota archaeon]
MASSSSKSYSWLDGKFIGSSEAAVPILTHSLQYASSIFEGIRAYKAERGTAIFRLQDHMRRFLRSAKIYDLDLGRSDKELCDAAAQLVRKNGLESCYIRPFAFYNDHQIGLSPLGKKVSTFIAAVPFGAYFGSGKEKGISCKVSSWKRINSSILPPEAKASGNYTNSIIANLEAKKSGADEAIMLSGNGHVAEGSGENIFIVKDGILLTPSREADILPGITRDSILKLAQNSGLETVERQIHREELYSADEVFFTGTASEVTPVTSVDFKKVGPGKPGPITRMLEEKYSAVVSGTDHEFEGWLTYV